MKQALRKLVLVSLAAAATTVPLAGCGGDGGGGSGTATISGNVASSSSARAEPQERSWLARLREAAAFVRVAFAQGVDGIRVSALRGGSEVSDVTDEDGEFDLPRSPTGDVTVRFEHGNCRAQGLLRDVTRNSTVTFENVSLDCDEVSVGRVAEVFQAVVQNKPSSPNGNLNVCANVGGEIRHRVVKVQNAAYEGGSFESLAVGDVIEAEGEREGLGAPSALDAEVVRILGPGDPDDCDVLLTPTPTPTETPTP